MKKIIALGVAFAFVLSPLLASADAVSDLQNHLQSLLAQIAELQGRISQLSGGPISSINTDPVVTIGTSTSANLKITGVHGASRLQVGQSGSWSVYANSATTTDTLQYQVMWGDSSQINEQTSNLLSHSYAQSGTYTIAFKVIDTVSGDFASATVIVVVSDDETAPTEVDQTCPTNIDVSLGTPGLTTDGQTGGKVTALQKFLASYLQLPASLVTGTFNDETGNAVKKFQTQQGITNTPVPWVGKLTRAAILTICSAQTTTGGSQVTAIPTSGNAPLTVALSFPSQWQSFVNTDCESIQSATGRVYRVDWGDGTIGGRNETSNDCTSHTYTSKGTYKINVTINDMSNSPSTPTNLWTSSATVTVGSGSITSACVAIGGTMKPNDTDASTGGDVSKLQTFLAQDPSIYPEGLITGVYGPATTRAVQRWQKAHSIISSGTPDTTGYGAVGPKTIISFVKDCAKPAQVGLSADKTSGSPPLTVNFKITGPSGIYVLDFGDGSKAQIIDFTRLTVECDQSSGACPVTGTAQHIYPAAGSFTANVKLSAFQTTEAQQSACTAVTYDPHDPLSFLDLNGKCVTQTSGAALSTVKVTVAASTPTGPTSNPTPLPVFSDTQTVFTGDDGSGNAAALSNVNPLWKWPVQGALWIWAHASGPSNPIVNQTDTFTRAFIVSGTPADLVLDIAADNTFTVSINGHFIGADTTGGTFLNSQANRYIVPAADLVTGNNTLSVTVTNVAIPGSTPTSNPAGLMFGLYVKGSEPLQAPQVQGSNSPDTWYLNGSGGSDGGSGGEAGGGGGGGGDPGGTG